MQYNSICIAVDNFCYNLDFGAIFTKKDEKTFFINQ